MPPSTLPNNEIVSMFKSGKTINHISTLAGVTKQAISHKLRKLGFSRYDGGASVGSPERKAQRLKRVADMVAHKKDLKCKFMYGCGRKEFLSITNGARTEDGSIQNKFWKQRNNAMCRGIKFNLTFPDWYKVWTDSGHLDNRGHFLGGYVMARFFDKGAYELGNVEIITSSQNVKDGYKNRGVCK